MQISLRKKRVNMEITQLLVPNYGQNNLEWNIDDNWIMIKEFKLPKGWVNKRTDSPLYNKPLTPLLIEIPSGYPNVTPQNFYAEQKLQCGTDFITHYFDRPGSGIPSINKYTDRGWAWLCIHIKAWDYKTNFAKGDNLLTICKLIFDILSDKRNARHNFYG